MEPLTEKDFESINFYHEFDGKIKCSQQLIEQILKIQEKARKWDEVDKFVTAEMGGDRHDVYLKDLTNAVKIVKHLKKRIEEKKANLDNFDDNRKTYTLKDIIVSELEELQKILGKN